jgi:hypothetical protein
MFNDVLSDIDGLETRPCKEYNFDEAMAVRDMLLSSANAILDEIYEGAGDRRRLSLSSAGPVSAPQDDFLAVVMRDALCAESVNLYTHHLLEGEKTEYGALSTLPLMPESEHVRDSARSLSLNEEYHAVLDEYEEIFQCSYCHDVLEDPEVYSDAPRWPDVYSTVIAKYQDPSDDGDVVELDSTGFPAPTTPYEVGTHRYSFPLRAAREDVILFPTDGMQPQMRVIINTGFMMYEYSPSDPERPCIASNLGFNTVTPDWMQVGPEDTTAFPCEDAVVNEINSTCWNRNIFRTEGLDDHYVWWSKAEDRPVRRRGPRANRFADYSSFAPLDEIDASVFVPPDRCLMVDVFYPQVPCMNPDVTGACEPRSPPTPGPLAPDTATTQGASGDGDLGGMAVGGIVLAGAVFAAVGVVVARRLKERRQQARRGSQLMEAGGCSVQEYEMDTSASDLSGPHYAAA